MTEPTLFPDLDKKSAALGAFGRAPAAAKRDPIPPGSDLKTHIPGRPPGPTPGRSAPVAGLCEPPPATTYEAQAAEWIEENPEAFEMFCLFALEAANRGRRFGAKALAERVRWECALKYDRNKGPKVNNNHVSTIARRLVDRYPHLDEYIEFRGASTSK